MTEFATPCLPNDEVMFIHRARIKIGICRGIEIGADGMFVHIDTYSGEAVKVTPENVFKEYNDAARRLEQLTGFPADFRSTVKESLAEIRM